ncbi:hypothetical protein AMJ57_01580 [Parcubacteria bacterium SG8_24]|nr:MAG: hypothetical protein AMJ57_01580 [Parcubacteria bacterium SG8_24]
MKKIGLVWQAAAAALGVFVYTSAVSWLLFNGEAIFGKAESFLMPVALLLLLVFSVAVVGVLIFGRPVWLYLQGAKKESVRLLLLTLAFLFVITSTVLLLNIVI